MVGAYRVESPDQCPASGGITTQIPPLFNGTSSWFNYEELIDDGLDLTVLEAGKRGPPSKNRQVGDAEMHKRLRNRESLRAENGVMCFQGYFETPLHQGVLNVLLEILSIFPSDKRYIEMVKWIGNFTLLVKRLRDAWMDILPVSAMRREGRETWYRNDVAQLNEERQRINATALDPNSQETRQRPVARHTGGQLRKVISVL